MTTLETTTFRLPAYWASYLVNGDASGLTDKEQTECDAWQDNNAEYYITNCEGEPYFAHSNDAGTLAGDCLDYTAILRGSDS